MRTVHSIYTMSLSRLCLMFETGDSKLILKRGWAPRFMLLGALSSFMKDFEGLYASKERNKFVQDELIKTTMFNRLLLCKVFLDAYYLERLNDNMVRWYESEFRTEAINAEKVLQRAKFYESKIKMYAKENEPKENENKDVSFDAVIVSVELVLGIPVDRKLSVYAFKSYFDQALQRSQKKE